MKVPTIAAVIAEAGPEKFGEENFKAAKAYLKAGGAAETEGQPQFVPPPCDLKEKIDLSFLGLIQDEKGNWTNPAPDRI